MKEEKVSNQLWKFQLYRETVSDTAGGNAERNAMEGHQAVTSKNACALWPHKESPF